MSHRLDWSKPFTEKDIEKLIEVFQSLPSHRHEEGAEPYILSTDTEIALHALNYYQSAEQCEAYKAYWDTHYEGVITLSQYLEVILADRAGPSAAALRLGRAYDRDGNGLISEEEFKGFVDLMVKHERKLKPYVDDYDKFLQEADVNKNGFISVAEFSNWIKRTLGI